MFDHLGFVVSDLARSRDFYLRALAPLGYGLVMSVDKAQTGGYEGHGFGPPQQPALWIGNGEVGSGMLASVRPASARPGDDTSGASGLHLALHAHSAEQVEAFHAAALAAGGRDNGAPGPRPHYGPGYFAAFVLDPDGHNLEAVYRGAAA